MEGRGDGTLSCSSSFLPSFFVRRFFAYWSLSASASSSLVLVFVPKCDVDVVVVVAGARCEKAVVRRLSPVRQRLENDHDSFQNYQWTRPTVIELQL